MTRNRRSAKAAGARFERQVADYLNETVSEWIDRRPKAGARDLGDLANVRLAGHKVVVEVKDVTRMDLPKWTAEAHTEAENDDALIGVVVHKRHGNADPADQWVTMTLADLAIILNTMK